LYAFRIVLQDLANPHAVECAEFEQHRTIESLRFAVFKATQCFPIYPGALGGLLDRHDLAFPCAELEAELLHIVSASEADRVYATDGAMCDCKGASHAWCWHRCAWHVVVLALALTGPHGLLAPVPLAFVTPAQPARLAA
jgi:hypothetical protein